MKLITLHDNLKNNKNKKYEEMMNGHKHLSRGGERAQWVGGLDGPGFGP